MSASVTIKNQIKSKIEGCPSVQKVYGYEEINPSGWPAVMLTPADMEGEFSSTTENSRVYGYKALILFPTGQDLQPSNDPAKLNRLEYAENVVATVIDEIINAIDYDFELDGTPVLYVEAADVSWGYITGDFGEARTAEITIKVYTEVTI
jgi:hypothetical protein